MWLSSGEDATIVAVTGLYNQSLVENGNEVGRAQAKEKRRRKGDEEENRASEERRQCSQRRKP